MSRVLGPVDLCTLDSASRVRGSAGPIVRYKHLVQPRAGRPRPRTGTVGTARLLSRTRVRHTQTDSGDRTRVKGRVYKLQSPARIGQLYNVPSGKQPLIGGVG